MESNGFTACTLDELADFRNGKGISPNLYTAHGRFPVFGANGELARTDELLHAEPVVVIGRVGAYCGCIHRVKESSWVTDNAIVATPKPGVDFDFLYYRLRSLGLERTAIGSAQPLVTQSGLKRVETLTCDSDEQCAIGSMLGALDDKIELNRRMNETLEALAQIVFKSWFVDGTQAGLPKGWRETTLGELAAISGGKQLPTKECKQSGKFPVFGANGIMGFGERATHEDFVIAFGRVGAYCGSIHWAYDGAWINNNASSVGPHCWPEFVLQAMLNVDFEAMRTGSAQPFIPNSALAAAKIIRPVDDVLDSYCAIARPLRLKQTRNEAESRTLAALRDTLLPKLLSGELRVKIDR